MSILPWDELPALLPVHFFAIEVDCHRGDLESVGRKHHLPHTSLLCDEEAFAEVYLAWDEKGISAQIEVSALVQKICHPNVDAGDAIELFIDTRNVKTSGYNTRFCHHFFFLPEAVDGMQAGELTHFRGEERHSLAEGGDLSVSCRKHRSGYQMRLFIPEQCLHGYAPDQFSYLGFSYRISRHRAAPQHFSAASSEFQIAQQPSLWATLKLVP